MQLVRQIRKRRPNFGGQKVPLRIEVTGWEKDDQEEKPLQNQLEEGNMYILQPTVIPT